MPIRLLIACRNENQARVLCTTIVQSAAGRLAGEAAGVKGVLARAREMQPDVLLLEHELAQETSSWQALARLRRANRGSRCLLLCDTCTHLMITAFVRHGVDGCVPRSSAPELIAKAVISVFEGQTWFGRAALRQALRSQLRAEPLPDVPAPMEEQDLLTRRECEILGLIGEAMSNKEIARQLKISDKTVKTHLHHIYVKLKRSGRYKAFLSNVGLVSSGSANRSAGPAQ